jgi:hypothetical protein
MNCKGLGRKRSWPNQSIILAFIWRDREVKRKFSEDSLCPARDSNRIFREHKSRAPCCMVKVSRRFGGTRRFAKRCLLSASCWFFAWHILCNPEQRGNMFSRNVGWLSMNYTVFYHRRLNSSELSLREPQILQVYSVRTHSSGNVNK